jgi:hypothetical protein
VNDAPVIVTPANALTTLEDTATTFVIGTQLAGKITDSDGTSIKGIGIWQNTSTNGIWAYSTDGGNSWVNFPSDLTSTPNGTNVMYLNATDSLRFTPNADANGTDLGKLDFRAIDPTFGTFTSGARVNTNNNYGGAGAVSFERGYFNVSVTAVNDAPVLTTTVVSMGAVNEDAAVPTGTAGTLVSDLFAAITDVDASATKGIAITDVNGNGTLHYSNDNGVTWQVASGLSINNALHLDASSRVFFRPNADWNGTIDNAFLYLAWDKTNSATVGSTTAITATTMRLW